MILLRYRVYHKITEREQDRRVRCGGSSDGKSSAKGGKTELEQFSVDYNLAFASYLLVLIPVLLVYLFCQKWIMIGVVAGAVK